MAKSITAAVARIQTIMSGVEDMRAAPTQPPDSPNVFPFAASWIGAVETTQPSATLRIRLFTVVTEIHVARKDMARDVAKINPFATSVPDSIWADTTLDGAVDTILTCNGALAPSSWAGVETLAWQFLTRVKIT